MERKLKRTPAVRSHSAPAPLEKSGKTPAQKIRIVLVEEQSTLREALAVTINLNPDLECCGQAANPRTAMQRVQDLKPDVVVTDLNLSGGNGLDLIHVLKVRFPGVAVAVLTAYGQSVYAESALHAGATGYILKSEPLDRVLLAIRTVAQGTVFVSEPLAARLLRHRITGRAAAQGAGLASLTARELQVFHLFGQWYNAKQIAHRLNISAKTVAYYRGKLKRKLGLEDSADVVRFATSWTEQHGSEGSAGRLKRTSRERP